MDKRLNEQFRLDELLFRAVLPPDMYWKESGQPTSAAFKDPKGLSVDRDGGRSIEEAADFLQSNLEGAIVYVTFADCAECDALVRYDPKDNNKWHSLVLRNNEKAELSKHQARHLAQKAVVYRHR